MDKTEAEIFIPMANQCDFVPLKMVNDKFQVVGMVEVV